MTVNLINKRSQTPMPRDFLKKWVQKCVREILRRKPSHRVQLYKKELTIVFLSAKEAQKLNHEYRGKNYPTDVLSFSSEHGLLLGELILCPQVLKKQARENKHSFKAECGYMILHGILHLLGYEHEGSARRAKKMYMLQDEIFAQLLAKK